MDSINKYIDICIINEYATKSFEDGYTLDIDSLPENEVSNFLDKLMREDTTIRDIVRYQMQLMIDDRLQKCEAKDRQAKGITLVHLPNGDSYLRYPRGESF